MAKSKSPAAQPTQPQSAPAGAESTPTSTPIIRALYRKYRPTKLSEVIGQPQVTEPLTHALESGQISHAYLFIGPRGTGKTSVARIFAHAVNGFDYQIEDHYLDIIEIDAASNTGVDNIRELREKAAIAPTTGRYKVYIIDEVHMLSKSAANALLKTLEEPPAHVIFILATTDAHKVPITIASRTQAFTFKLADSETMQQHLRAIADAEQLPITDDALALIVRRGGGSFRDSLSLLDQISTLSDQEITADVVERALGLPASQTLADLLQAYAAQDATSIHQILQDLLSTGLKPEIIASELITRILTTPDPALLPLLERLTSVQAPFPEAKLLLALLGPSSRAPESHRTPTPKPLRTPPSASSDQITSAATPQNTLKTPKPAPKPSPSAPKTASVSPAAPNPDPAPTTTADPAAFNWQTFLDQVHQLNDAVFLQLQKVSHELQGDTLHLYPQQKFTATILERPNNRQLLSRALSGLSLVIHAPGAQPAPAAEDPTLSQISAIMGNVQAVDEDAPF